MDTSLGSKLLIGAVLLGGLVLAFFAGTFISEENYFMLLLILFGLAGLAFVLIAGPRYWILVPVALNSSFPALPVGGGRTLDFAELAVAGCIGLYIVGVALKRERLSFLRVTHIPVLVFIGWAGFIYLLNPSGLAIFGSANVGARFYLRLFLAFGAFLILASRQPSEKDIWLLLGWLLFIVFPSTAYNIYADIRFVNPLATGMAEYYTWHQNLAAPAGTLMLLAFSRFAPSEFFSVRRLYLPLLYVAALALALNSGKRMAVLGLLTLPALAAVIHRQYRYIFVGAALAGLFVIGVWAGHNKTFTFPKTVQRALSWLPAEWDPEFKAMQSGTDEWRAEIREIAKKIASENPIFGRGYSLDVDTMAANLFVTAGNVGGGIQSQVAAYAYGRAWHNIWYGYTADFGLPVTIAQAFIFLVSIAVSYRVANLKDAPLAYKTFAIYCFLTTCNDVMTSWTSGHTANDAFTRWWKYGLLFAVFHHLTARAGQKRLSAAHGSDAAVESGPPADRVIIPGRIAFR